MRLSASAGSADLPERLGDHAEHGSAVEQVGAVGADGQVEVTELLVVADQVVIGRARGGMHANWMLAGREPTHRGEAAMNGALTFRLRIRLSAG